MPPPRAERGPLDLDRHPTHTRNPHLSDLLSPLPPSTSPIELATKAAVKDYKQKNNIAADHDGHDHSHSHSHA